MGFRISLFPLYSQGLSKKPVKPKKDENLPENPFINKSSREKNNNSLQVPPSQPQEGGKSLKASDLLEIWNKTAVRNGTQEKRKASFRSLIMRGFVIIHDVQNR